MADKKKIFTGIGVLLGVLTCIQAVAGYQTAYDAAVNKIGVGNITTGIDEEFPTPPPVSPEENTEISKKIWVTNKASGTNETSVNCYVRVAVGYSDNDIGKAVMMNGQDTENWIYCDDGFYYYKNILKEGESSSPLCTGFTVNSAKLEKTYWEQLENFQIQVYEESVEANGFDDYKSAWAYYGSEV